MCFQVGAAAGGRCPTRLPSKESRCSAGLAFLGGHSEAGHGAYAFGLYSDRGWWWYFPAAWIVKTPIPLLLATGLGVGIALRSFRERAAELALWGGALLFYAIPVIASSINIGVRHMLPVVPFLAVLGGESAARLWRGGRLPRAAVALGALWLMVGTLRAHTNLLGYSNEIFGGPKGTWRYLAGSNVDWGQDLPLLARELSKEPLRRLYLGYLGSADPSAAA